MMEAKEQKKSILLENLNRYIRDKGIKVSFIQDRLDFNVYTKLNGTIGIRLEEFEAICEVLNIDLKDLI